MLAALVVLPGYGGGEPEEEVGEEEEPVGEIEEAVCFLPGWNPSGIRFVMRRGPVVFAALDHRLLAVIPPGS
ncbi:MAG: hypothetical protein EOP83_23105 [Verrucomicrobiaceae bacterium]|nr:MAG: hypothetical protein EOP83_23105 [Verrucomicrobiaceae bacterium]